MDFPATKETAEILLAGPEYLMNDMQERKFFEMCGCVRNLLNDWW